MQIIKISLFFILTILTGCVERYKTEKIEEIMDLKLHNLFENARNDGMHPDVQSVFKAMKMIRVRNQNFNNKAEDVNIFDAIRKEINWGWLEVSSQDSIGVCSQIETLLKAKTKEEAILEELTLL